MSGVGRQHTDRRPSLLWINQFALLPSDGGGTRHFELGRELVRRGWDVTILASDFHLHKRSYSRRADARDRRIVAEQHDGVDFKWLWAAEYRENDYRRINNWVSFARSVTAAAPRLPVCDVVVGSSPQLLAANSSRQVARRLDVPFVFEVRDLWPESLLAAGGNKGLAYFVLDRIADRLYRGADRVLTLAEGTKDYLINKGVPGAKCVCIPNGVDVHAMHPGTARSNGGAPFTLVYSGAHGQANGLDQLLNAAQLIGERGGIRFVLVGDGPGKPSLLASAQRRGLHWVEFRDSVSKPELQKILATADAGLMLLRDAPLFSFAVSPNKLFDYLAAGLPVVCNVPGEVAGMLARAEAGVQVRNSSDRALADAITTLRDTSADRRTQMGAAGRAWVIREHSREVLGTRLDTMLSELIGR